MFLLHSVFVLSIIYWVSAIVADIVLASNEERLLMPAVRVGYGFLISLVYFSASWLVLSIQQTWTLGVILLLLYGFAHFSFKNILITIPEFCRKYAKTFLFFLLGAGIFFAPLIISNNYGPFTEGGGDISIYSDTAKYLQERSLTERGSSSKDMSDVFQNIRNITSYVVPEKRWSVFDRSLIDPPSTEYAVYRNILRQSVSSFLYVPYGMYAFLSHQNNYPTYFGIQAFFYVCLLAGIASFFRQFSVKISNLAILLLVASHGLISVFYNMYAMQASFVAVSALILAALPVVRLISLGGFRTYGSALILMCISYPLYFSVVLPMLLGVAAFAKIPKIKTISLPKQKFSLLTVEIGIIFVVLWAFAIWVGSEKAYMLIKSLLTLSFLSPHANSYFGDGVSFFSFQWIIFLFGFLSQQHFYPFAEEFNTINFINKLGIFFGVGILLMGFWVMCKIYFSSFTFKNKQKRLYLAVYLIAILTVALQACLAHSSLYFEAKGAQNVLVYFYVAMLLPLAVGTIAVKEGLNIRKSLNILSLTLIFFISALFITKITYTAKLAFGHDRGGILESSYFKEAKRIKRTDGQAFVLFEPRKSADLYISIQPFFGNKMVSTRDLAVQKAILDPRSYWVDKDVFISDLIEQKDAPHLWILHAVCKNKWSLLHVQNCIWKAERLSDRPSPFLILLGAGYERNFGQRSFSKKTDATQMVSYIRKGEAMLFFPRGGGNVEVFMQPREEMNYKTMLGEVTERVANGEFGQNVNLASDGQNIKLTYKIPEANAPFLKLIARSDGEYWLNVKLNKHEIS